MADEEQIVEVQEVEIEAIPIQIKDEDIEEDYCDGMPKADSDARPQTCLSLFASRLVFPPCCLPSSLLRPHCLSFLPHAFEFGGLGAALPVTALCNLLPIYPDALPFTTNTAADALVTFGQTVYRLEQHDNGKRALANGFW